MRDEAASQAAKYRLQGDNAAAGQRLKDVSDWDSLLQGKDPTAGTEKGSWIPLVDAAEKAGNARQEYLDTVARGGDADAAQQKFQHAFEEFGKQAQSIGEMYVGGLTIVAGEGGNIIVSVDDLSKGNFTAAALNLLPLFGPMLKKMGGKLLVKSGDGVVSALDNEGVAVLWRKLSEAGCFVAGTAVATDRGLRPIESILAGDLVWAYSPKLRQWSLEPVVAPLRIDYGGDFVSVTIEGAEIEATGNHPFWVVDGDCLEDRPVPSDVPPNERAEAIGGRWVEARSLRAGDILRRRSGATAVVAALSVTIKRQPVYNLWVDEIHTYAVSPYEIVVHNNSEECAKVVKDALKNTSYRSVNEAGEVVYVGITNNLARRAAEHLRTKGILIEKVLGGLSRTDARAVEQTLVEIHKLGTDGGTLLNKINSIARTNPAYADALRRGTELLESIGYKAGM